MHVMRLHHWDDDDATFVCDECPAVRIVGPNRCERVIDGDRDALHSGATGGVVVFTAEVES